MTSVSKHHATRSLITGRCGGQHIAAGCRRAPAGPASGPSQGRATGVLLPAAAGTAFASTTQRFERHVADLSTRPGPPSDQMAVDDDCASEPGADGDQHQRVASPMPAESVFGPTGCAGVVLNAKRQRPRQTTSKLSDDIEMMPVQVGGR